VIPLVIVGSKFGRFAILYGALCFHYPFAPDSTSDPHMVQSLKATLDLVNRAYPHLQLAQNTSRCRMGVEAVTSRGLFQVLQGPKHVKMQSGS
jgi:hypothetical protein